MPAGTLAAIHNVEQFTDLLESEPDSLGAPDEAEPIHECGVVEPVSAVAARRDGQKSKALVVSDRVRRNAGCMGDAGNGESAHHCVP